MSVYIKANLWVEKPVGYIGELDLTCYITSLISKYGTNHPPVTIAPGLGNGLAIVGASQVLSLETADTDTTGALTKEDWNKFNDGLDKNFVFEQPLPSTDWYMEHGLGKYPSVTAFDSAGTEVKGAVVYHSIDALTIKFNSAFTGTATLN